MKNYKCLLLAAVTFIQLSCKKEPDPSPSPSLSNKDYLTMKPWKLITLEAKKNNDPWQVQNAAWVPCQTDNEWVFLTTGKMQITEGQTKCFPGDAQLIGESDWTMDAGQAKIIVTSGINTNDWIIEKLTADEFSSSGSIIIGSDTYYTKRYMRH